MHANPARRPLRPTLLALLIGLAAILPGPLLAATPNAPLVDGAASVTPASPDDRVGNGAWSDVASVTDRGPLWRFEAYLVALDSLAGRLAAPAPAAPAAAPTTPASVARTALHPVVASAPAYVGRNHLWIPALGLSRSVAAFACSRSTPPANQVYRWGCAGANNIYLFGHAWGVMKPLHDAYVAGRVRPGMVAIYADGSGRVHTFRVTETRVVTPDQTSWATAAQSRLSMTLQTCLGAKSQFRLLVRLVAIR